MFDRYKQDDEIMAGVRRFLGKEVETFDISILEKPQEKTITAKVNVGNKQN